jgi:AraC-like DNA-binding protein
LKGRQILSDDVQQIVRVAEQPLGIDHLRNAMPAATAAFNVGYQSASQFSREFKRFFGRTPQAEIEWMKATYALPAPSTPSIYVSSH